MKRTDIRRNTDGSFKPQKPLKRTALKPIGPLGRRLKKADAKTKKALIEERGDVCEMARTSPCSDGLDLHHIATKGAHPELRQDGTNHILVCRKHHDELHGRKWKQ